MKLISNYHTHTYRCGHAVGEDEEYILAAISKGIKILGFSDHISFPGYSFKGTRPDRIELFDYTNSILNLKEKYKDQIEIHIGFEAEYIKEFVDDYRLLLKEGGIEYLILGQHCQIFDGKQAWYNSHHHSEEYLTKYIDDVIEGIKTGLFSYIAHPDHFMNGYRVWDEFAIKETHRLLKVVERYQIPLEINLAGIRFAEHKHRKNKDGRPIENLYPFLPFWKLVSQYNIKGIIGVDAHSPNDFLDGVELEAIAFAKQLNIPLIEHLDFKKIK